MIFRQVGIPMYQESVSDIVPGEALLAVMKPLVSSGPRVSRRVETGANPAHCHCMDSPDNATTPM